MSESKISFHFEIDGFSLEKEQDKSEWLLAVVAEEKKELSHINYVFCSDEQLLEINRKYLNHDYYTDIISFPFKEDPIEGDIYISIDRVKENAHDYQSSFVEELCRVMVHGLLHFIGYDDHEEKDIQTMRAKENHYLGKYLAPE